MSKISLTLWGILLLPLLGLSQRLELEVNTETEPRNVIFILSDDHRYDFMSFMEPEQVPWLETPNLDRIAAGGAHLTNAFVTTSLCSPSRASILTGQFSHHHEVVDNHSLEPEGLIYFPEYLTEVGYQTSFFGKWHMGDAADHPRPGFDRWVSYRGQGRYYGATLNVDGKEVQRDEDEYTPTVVTDYAIDWLREREQAQPFFMYLSYKAVHAQFEPAPDVTNRYHGKPIYYPASASYTQEDLDPRRVGENVNLEDIPEWVKEQRYSWHGVDYAYHGLQSMDTVIYTYCETLYSMDREIGRLMDWLEAEGLAESTLIIYMGDNGFQFGEKGLIDKRDAYEPSMRVPMLAHCPELIEPGSTIEAVVQNIDIAPTVLEMAGVYTPDQMDGRSMAPLFAGDQEDWRDRIFYEYFWEPSFPQTPTMFAVRTDRYKYIFNYGVWDANELYDLQEDPDEVNNLIRSEAHTEIALELKQALFDWLEETNGLQIPLKAPPARRIDWKYHRRP